MFHFSCFQPLHWRVHSSAKYRLVCNSKPISVEGNYSSFVIVVKTTLIILFSRVFQYVLFASTIRLFHITKDREISLRVCWLIFLSPSYSLISFKRSSLRYGNNDLIFSPVIFNLKCLDCPHFNYKYGIVVSQIMARIVRGTFIQVFATIKLSEVFWFWIFFTCAV